ncbi:hypothetical protein K490DRAFT_60093 [Saccharata proteae CBS 121410]|uniref:Uncharacterized protein n=1 Tax=Saccharata proteae CBS 121410 TaxID=1314787 RepID=A0A9P4HQ09_9PEZI|nr:hypothetical protein K490DRAFT_60093 [Saccharata proteae CBS 121410]
MHRQMAAAHQNTTTVARITAIAAITAITAITATSRAPLSPETCPPPVHSRARETLHFDASVNLCGGADALPPDDESLVAGHAVVMAERGCGDPARFDLLFETSHGGAGLIRASRATAVTLDADNRRLMTLMGVQHASKPVHPADLAVSVWSIVARPRPAL